MSNFDQSPSPIKDKVLYSTPKTPVSEKMKSRGFKGNFSVEVKPDLSDPNKFYTGANFEANDGIDVFDIGPTSSVFDTLDEAQAYADELYKQADDWEGREKNL